MRDYYNILGIPSTATIEEIKNAYIKLTTRPLDKGSRVSPLICEAFDVLGDEKKRAEYDQTLIKRNASTTSRILEPLDNVTQPLANLGPQEPTDTLYVGNLAPGIKMYVLDKIFSGFGTLENIDLVYPYPGTGKTAPFAFVKFNRVDMAYKAKMKFNGQRIGKLECLIEFAKERRPQEPSNTMYVSNLEPRINEFVLGNVFSRFGSILSIALNFHGTGKSIPYAFIKFTEIEMAIKAKMEFNGHKIGKLECNLQFALNETDRDQLMKSRSHSSRARGSGDNDSWTPSSTTIWNSGYRGESTFKGPQPTELESLRSANQGGFGLGKLTLVEKPSDLPIQKMKIPQKYMPDILGKRMWRKSEIENETGTKLILLKTYWDMHEWALPVTIGIQGTEENIGKAREMIQGIIKGKEDPVIEVMQVPRAHFYLLRSLKRIIRDMTGCFYIHFGDEDFEHLDKSIPRPPLPNMGETFEIKISGIPKQIQKAIELIQNRIQPNSMDSNCDE